MLMKIKDGYFIFLIIIILLIFNTAHSQVKPCGQREKLWIDLYRGEPLDLQDIVEDIKTVQVIYLCEIHSIERHHNLHNDIIQKLIDNNKSIVLGLEQMEAFNQGELDNYNNNKIDFNGLAEKTKWNERWSNYQDYKVIIENVRKTKGRIIALNARSEIVKKIGQKGLINLSKEDRNELPLIIDTRNADQNKLLNMILGVHAMMDPANLQTIIEAQTTRDEMMADIIYKNIKLLKENEVIVAIGGSMHFAYGFGVPGRVKKRIPSVKERIIMFSESGDLVLSPAEKAMAREIDITHEDLRFIKNPIADYLHIIEPEGKQENE